MDKNVNRYTGEVLPFRTVSNVLPDEGINKDPGEDLCRLEDFESISDVCARFIRSGVDNSSEFAYVNPDPAGLNDDSISN